MTTNLYINEHSKSKECGIYAYVRGVSKGKTIVIHTGQRIPAKYWDSKRQIAKRAYTGSPELNSLLSKIRESIKSEYRQTITNDETASFESIKNILKNLVARINGEQEETVSNPEQEQETHSTLIQVADDFLESRKTDLGQATIKKYKALRNILIDFDQSLNPHQSSEYSDNVTTKTIPTGLPIHQFNLRQFDSFKQFLIEEKGHVNGTVHKYTALLKSLLKWSKKRGYHNSTEFEEFKAKHEATDIVYLSESELFRLLDFDFSAVPIEVTGEDLQAHLRFTKASSLPPDREQEVRQVITQRKRNKLKTLEGVRDVFCFGCFSGQRFSDLANLKHTDIRNGYWHLRQVKTKDPLKIPLNQFALEILSKYRNDNKALPTISAQKSNRYLKLIASMVGIDEPVTIVRYRGSERIEMTEPKHQFITTHTARRTFVTLSLQRGMRAETCMAITGHRSMKSFARYIKISDTVKETEMNHIWSKR